MFSTVLEFRRIWLSFGKFGWKNFMNIFYRVRGKMNSQKFRKNSTEFLRVFFLSSAETYLSSDDSAEFSQNSAERKAHPSSYNRDLLEGSLPHLKEIHVCICSYFLSATSEQWLKIWDLFWKLGKWLFIGCWLNTTLKFLCSQFSCLTESLDNKAFAKHKRAKKKCLNLFMRSSSKP